MSFLKQTLTAALFVVVTFTSFYTSAAAETTTQANTQQSATRPNMEALKARYFDAAREGDSAMLGAFYQAGLDVNVADEKGYTALILAAYHGHTDTINFLIGEANANPCQEDNRGNTALMGAIFKGHVSVAKQLVFADCDIDEENAQGQTALMFASLFDRQEIINTLIDKGANPAHMDKAGNSVADIALSQGNYELAKVLREQNAN
ncbi:ankyrin repeat domain-containing protein [Alteromonas sp. ALT199]|uniref:ankyrin repeat domain-containing protein n=1 Tax=unclassified Alteromonas TaxID=2614992 RepID=UPI001BE96BFB|nr:ankyrin repeat domain-containing protein [Alteromonas sp. ALT199]MBT3137132.1 ankyrin repeat domain-containing protein [Alteromonas sp. ALT199]